MNTLLNIQSLQSPGYMKVRKTSAVRYYIRKRSHDVSFINIFAMFLKSYPMFEVVFQFRDQFPMRLRTVVCQEAVMDRSNLAPCNRRRSTGRAAGLDCAVITRPVRAGSRHVPEVTARLPVRPAVVVVVVSGTAGQRGRWRDGVGHLSLSVSLLRRT